MHTVHEFLLFYDGQCPLCCREVAWLRARNRCGKLRLQDIHAPDFDPAIYATSMEALMAEIHGLLPDGRLVKGMDAFYAAYSAVGLGWLMAPTRWPLLKDIFDRLYLWFARHRLRLGALLGRNCQGKSCGMQKSSD